ncbi:MAG: hypothetical protein GX369_06515 [Euryarchaeota archaeon]|nr:hypothetical protein [Euryarchaeota archaeon]
MTIEFTITQMQRLKELGVSIEDNRTFLTVEERELEFSKMASHYHSQGREAIRNMLDEPERHPLAQLEDTLAQALVKKNFIEVKTPTIIARNTLEKMGIGQDHPLYEQVFWVDKKRCLRPMLAPNLYFLMRHLKRNINGPLRLFEIGTCYRRESRGSNHLEDFTMLNLVELGPENDPTDQLHSHISTVMGAVDLDYKLKTCQSEVYVHTTDVEVNGIEVASAAVGPHILDDAHGIKDPWAGVGFGLERLLMIKNDADNIKRVGRSLIYLRGVRLDI